MCREDLPHLTWVTPFNTRLIIVSFLYFLSSVPFHVFPSPQVSLPAHCYCFRCWWFSIGFVCVLSVCGLKVVFSVLLMMIVVVVVVVVSVLRFFNILVYFVIFFLFRYFIIYLFIYLFFFFISVNFVIFFFSGVFCYFLFCSSVVFFYIFC